MHVACPACRKTVGVPDDAAGKRVRCPLCQQPFVVPPTQAVTRPVTPPPVLAELNEPDIVSGKPTVPFWYVGGSPAFVLLLGGIGGGCVVLGLVIWVAILLLSPASDPPAGSRVDDARVKPIVVDKDGQQIVPFKPPLNEKPLEITAEELCIEYHANPVDGKNKYHNKLLQVTGTVESIHVDGNRSYVQFKGKPPEQFESYIDRVYAFFPNQQHMAGLRKGDRATFLGRGGEWNGPRRTLELHDCRPVPK